MASRDPAPSRAIITRRVCKGKSIHWSHLRLALAGAIALNPGVRSFATFGRNQRHGLEAARQAKLLSPQVHRAVRRAVFDD